MLVLLQLVGGEARIGIRGMRNKSRVGGVCTSEISRGTIVEHMFRRLASIQYGCNSPVHMFLVYNKTYHVHVPY